MCPLLQVEGVRRSASNKLKDVESVKAQAAVRFSFRFFCVSVSHAESTALGLAVPPIHRLFRVVGADPPRRVR